MPAGIKREDLEEREGGLAVIVKRKPAHTWETVVHPMTGLVAVVRIQNHEDRQYHEAHGFKFVEDYLSDEPGARQVQFWDKKREGVIRKVGITRELADHIDQLAAQNTQAIKMAAARSPRGVETRNIAQAAAAGLLSGIAQAQTLQQVAQRQAAAVGLDTVVDDDSGVSFSPSNPGPATVPTPAKKGR